MPTTASAGLIKSDITNTVLKLQQQSPKVVVDLTSLPPNYLQGAISHLMGKGLAGINFYIDDLNLAVKDTQILELLLGKMPQYAECRMNLPQSATAIYYLFNLLTSGRTPDPNDNAVHVTFAELRTNSTNTNLQGSLYAKIKDGKPDKLFQKGSLPPAVAPGMGHNPAAMSVGQTVTVDAVAAPAGGTTVHDPVSLLLAVAGNIPIDDPNPGQVIYDAGRVLFG